MVYKDYLAFQKKSSITDKIETKMKHKTRIPTKHMNTHTYTHTATLEEIMYTERRKLKKKTTYSQYFRKISRITCY